MVVKVDAKDDVEFEDRILNDRSNFNNVDKTFTFDGMVNIKALKLGNELFKFKITDVHRGMELGNLKALLSKV